MKMSGTGLDLRLSVQNVMHGELSEGGIIDSLRSSAASALNGSQPKLSASGKGEVMMAPSDTALDILSKSAASLVDEDEVQIELEITMSETNTALPLFSHQIRTLNWILSVESSFHYCDLFSELLSVFRHAPHGFVFLF